jgi:hypothetical protein
MGQMGGGRDWLNRAFPLSDQRSRTVRPGGSLIQGNQERRASMDRESSTYRIDTLAAACGATLVVHGHHHTSYAAVLPNGIKIKGMGLADAWLLDDPHLSKLMCRRRL